MDIITTLAAIPGVAPWLPYITAAIAICAAVAATLPRPAAGATGVYPVIYTVINFVAFNIGKARNVDAPTPKLPAV